MRRWLSQYQFIWWGLRAYNGPFVRFERLTYRGHGSLSTVYSWWFVLGPVEVRRWNPELEEGL